MKKVVYLDAGLLIQIHDVLLDRWGGEEGGGHRGEQFYEGADAAVQAVKNSYYETLYELAAAYAVYIVQGHVFLDGNKRSGAAALTTFLEFNGIRVKLRPDHLTRLMKELQRRAEAGEKTGTLIRWIAAEIDDA